MIINLISYYAMKIYISNKKHEKNEYIEENDIYYISEDKGKILDELNVAMKNRNSEIEDLKSKKINEIEIYNGFKIISTEENNIFEVMYVIPEFQSRFLVIREKINDSYVFKFYKDN